MTRPGSSGARVLRSLPPALAARLGTSLSDQAFTAAMTHRSYAYEHGGLPTNERLEFLGDAVLGIVVTDALFRTYPDLPESALAPLRSSVVNMRALAAVARDIGLGEQVLLGKGELATGGRDKASILADALEALLGAVHIDRGPAEAWAVVVRLFEPVMAEAAAGRAGTDWKTALQELTTAAGLGPPDYAVSETGPDHAKRFTAVAMVRPTPDSPPRPLGEGAGGTKKEAEQVAARHAHAALDAPAQHATVSSAGGA